MLNKIIYTILGIGITLVFFPHVVHDSINKGLVSGVSTQAMGSSIAAPEIATQLVPPTLTAHAALALDLSSGSVLYSLNLDEKLPIASLTKLMTALVVSEHTDLNAEVTIDKADLTPIGATVGLVAGEKIKVADLLQAMLIPSGNDAALALARFVGRTPEKFAELMNEEANKLKLADTHFSNPVGWDSFENQENFSNALDLSKIVQEFLQHNELAKIVAVRETAVQSTDGRYTHQLKTTNQLMLDNSEISGIKTGFTSKALGNLIILDNHEGNQILTIVLGSQNREADSQKLLDWIIQAYRW